MSKKMVAVAAIVLACLVGGILKFASPAAAASYKPAVQGQATENVEIGVPTLAEAKAKLARDNAERRLMDDPIQTLAVITKCANFDVQLRNYPTCVDWIWDSIANKWRPGYHYVDRPTGACSMRRLDADFGVGSTFTLVQRKGIEVANSDFLQLGFSTAFYSDSQNPRVNTKLTTMNNVGTTCNKVAHQTIFN